jgi:hypothetical protein
VPSGTDYDLEAFCDGCDDPDTRLVSDTAGNQTEEILMGWEDLELSDSSRDVWIRVNFYSSATCLEDDWRLDILGNFDNQLRTCPAL